MVCSPVGMGSRDPQLPLLWGETTLRLHGRRQSWLEQVQRRRPVVARTALILPAGMVMPVLVQLQVRLDLAGCQCPCMPARHGAAAHPQQRRLTGAASGR